MKGDSKSADQTTNITSSMPTSLSTSLTSKLSPMAYPMTPQLTNSMNGLESILSYSNLAALTSAAAAASLTSDKIQSRPKGSTTPPLYSSESQQPKMDLVDKQLNCIKRGTNLNGKNVVESTISSSNLQLKRKLTFSKDQNLKSSKRVRSTKNAKEASKEKKLSGRWTSAEHSRFLEGLKKHGKDWRRIANYIGSRNYVQTRTHAQKYFKKIAKLRQGMGEDIPFEFMSTANNGKKWDFDQSEVSTECKQKKSLNVLPTLQSMNPQLAGFLPLTPNPYACYPMQMNNTQLGMNPLNPAVLQYLAQIVQNGSINNKQ